MPRGGTWSSASGGRAGDPQFVETVPGLNGFRTLWITRNQALQLLHSSILLPQFQEGKALFELCGRAFVSPGILIEDLVVILNSSLKIAPAVINLAQVELSVPGEIIIAISLEELSKLLRCQIVFARLEVT